MYFSRHKRYRKIFRTIIFILLSTNGCQNNPTNIINRASYHIRGVTLADWSASGYNSAAAMEQIKAIHSTGATHISIVITAYQTSKNTHEIHIDPLLTPTLPQLYACIDMATQMGLSIALKPHVDLYDNSWRKEIDPDDPVSWFKSYHQFILPLAAFSDSIGAPYFIIGTELAGTLQYHQLWKETIGNIKSIFSGKLLYAASWDEASLVPFWDEIDYLGINFYCPITDRLTPSRFEILAGWQPWLNHLEMLHHKTGQKIVLTEIGYRSIDGAGMKPHDFQYTTQLDLSEQADLYWAALQAVHDLAWLEGLYWWNWLADGSGGSNNSDYTPAGKPAARQLRSAWKR